MEDFLKDKEVLQEESLLGNDDGIEEAVEVEESELDDVGIDNQSIVLSDDIKQAIDLESRKKYFSDPENQADIILQNYVKSSEILINHSQRRKLRKEFLKNAKKGKYKKMFNEVIYGVSKEESEKRFNNLNS